MRIFNKTFIAIGLILCAPSIAQAQDTSTDQANSIRNERYIENNHSVSIQILGAEYSYEFGIGRNWSLISRAGIIPAGINMYSDNESAKVDFSISPAVTIEPRLYTSFARRASLGKSTYNNSSDFVSFRTSIMMYSDEFGVVMTPMYGIRRSGGKHWVHEFTFGPKMTILKKVGLTPHLQYRLIFRF